MSRPQTQDALTTATAAVEAAREANRQIKTRLGELDTEIDQLLAEREAMLRALPPREELAELVGTWLDGLAGELNVWLYDRIFQPLRRSARPAELDLNNLRTADLIVGYRGASGQIIAEPSKALLALLRPALEPALREAIMKSDAYPSEPAGLPRAERQKRVAALDAKLGKLDAEREALRREAAAAGVQFTDYEAQQAEGRKNALDLVLNREAA